MTVAAPVTGAERALLTLALSLATFMQVLDTTIANVSIPTIAGDLAVSPDEGTWVITSFAVSTAIVVPLTGWLAKRFGEVRLFVLATLLFSVASWLCGLAPSMPVLVAFRVFQGAVAGPMIPLSQSLLLSIYPPERRGLALAISAMTTVLAPIFGPILGGYISDNISWPWIFYINIPVGAVSAYVVWQMLRKRETAIVKSPIDMVGLALLVVGVGALQVMLDKGNELDWFGSSFIVVLAAVAAVALTSFGVWELTDAHPIVELRLFARRNFAVGTIAISLGYLAFFGGVVVFPLWLQTQQGYTATWAGLAAAPIGVLALVFAPLVGRYMQGIDARLLASFSFLVFAMTSFWYAGFNTSVSFEQLVIPRLVQGAGMAFFFIPLITIALAGLPQSSIASAVGLTTFVRILAGSFGTSLSITLWDRRTSLHQAQLSENIGVTDPVSQSTLAHLQALGMSAQAALADITHIIIQQAVMLATNDVFWLAGWLFLALLALVWFAKPPFTTASRGAGRAAH